MKKKGAQTSVPTTETIYKRVIRKAEPSQPAANEADSHASSQSGDSVRKLVRHTKKLVVGFVLILTSAALVATAFLIGFEKKYEGKIYPKVTIGGIPFGGKTEAEAIEHWENQSDVYSLKLYEFRHEEYVATASGADLGLGYDAQLSARQAYLVGRSGNSASDLVTKISGDVINVEPVFRFKEGMLDELLVPISETLVIPVQEALFEFQDGKVTEFKPSHEGREVDTDATKKYFSEILKKVPEMSENTVVIPLAVRTIKPSITTDSANEYGIRELIGQGYSEYQGSIPGRKHNVKLGASKLHGVLIKPGEELSFNDTIGDISAATGFLPAYVIKSGRTVLGDGGGVCQVSTTLFRAALNAGLPILARSPHAYRVHYYEEAGYKAGIDATVFSPTVDLKIKNDTSGYILIQTKVDESVPSLTFDLYGTTDGRKAEIIDHKVWGITAPPAPLYQDDPTLPEGVVKQVDFSAWGAKASFQYKVTSAEGNILQDQTFSSNYRPWQAVFLKGTKTP